MVTSKTNTTVSRLVTRLRGRSLDERLLAGAPFEDEAVAHRGDELVSPGHRRSVAAGLRRLVDLVERPSAAESVPVDPSRAVPLRRRAIEESRGQLLALAGDLEHLDEVPPRGVILASRLVDDASSPAFAVSRERRDLGHAVRYARAALRDR